jgi:hypothetical protein
MQIPTYHLRMTDIISGNYLSNGRFLNSTMSLVSPLNKTKLPSGLVSYGMLIDSDFNNSTGVQGAEYRVSVN